MTPFLSDRSQAMTRKTRSRSIIGRAILPMGMYIIRLTIRLHIYKKRKEKLIVVTGDDDEVI